MLNDVAAAIWRHLQQPHTEDELVEEITREFDVGVRRATDDLRTFLTQMLKDELVCRLGDEADSDRPSVDHAKRLLEEAFDRAESKDWNTFSSLCLEAAKDPKYQEIAAFNLLIGRYHQDVLEGLATEAIDLADRLPTPPRYECIGLALASAFKTHDTATARHLACRLAREVTSPWDLPTIPTFSMIVGKRVIVVEAKSGSPMLKILDSLLADSETTDEERDLLWAVSDRYRARGE